MRAAFAKSEILMATLNLLAARLMKRHGARAATDITGFGAFGHSNLLATCQKQHVKFHIHTMPFIRNTLRIDKIVRNFRLVEGYSSETSGGLLICLPPESAQNFVTEMIKYGQHALIVGDVIPADDGVSGAIIDTQLKIFEVD